MAFDIGDWNTGGPALPTAGVAGRFREKLEQAFYGGPEPDNDAKWINTENYGDKYAVKLIEALDEEFDVFFAPATDVGKTASFRRVADITFPTSGTAVHVTFAQTEFNDDGVLFSTSGGELTIDQAGRYRLHLELAAKADTPVDASAWEAWVERDSGSGFVLIPETRKGSFSNGTSMANSKGNMSSTITLNDVVIGEKVRVMIWQTSGSSDMTYVGGTMIFEVAKL